MTETSTTPPGAEVEGSQSEQLFQALERFIEHMETSERTLEWIEEQAREGSALRPLLGWGRSLHSRHPGTPGGGSE